MMTTSAKKDKAVLFEVVRELGCLTNPYIGHIVRTLFLVKECGGIEVSLDYVLYAGTPWSEEAKDMLSNMILDGSLVNVDIPRSYGYSIKASTLKDEELNTLSSRDMAIIRCICHQLSGLSLKDMGDMSTACWIEQHEHLESKDDMISLFMRLRPCTFAQEAKRSFDQVSLLHERIDDIVSIL